MENLEDVVRRRLVQRIVALDEDALRAEALRPLHRHGGVDAVCPRLVRARRDDAAPGEAADDEGFSAILRVLALLDGCEERVHVDVENGAVHGFHFSNSAAISSFVSFDRKFSPGWIIWSMRDFFFSCSW